MKNESIILNVYPLNKNSLVLVSFDELRLPYKIDFGSIQIVDNNNNRLLFDLINKKNYIKKFKYSDPTKENYIAIIINRENVKYIRVTYKTERKATKRISPRKTISLENDSYLAVSAANASILFDKKSCVVEKIKIKNQKYGPLQLAVSGGKLFSQKDMEEAKLEIISDSNIIKIIKIEGRLKSEGDKCKKQGFLPFEIMYYFWSPDTKNIIGMAEIELKYDKATDFNGNKTEFLDPLVWYRLDNFNKKISTNSFFIYNHKESKIAILKHPYYSCFQDDKAFFAMFPHLALPNDGIHIEKGKDFFGACWHSMSEPEKSYWAADEKEFTGKSQGYYPAHSLRAYWKIGLYFGEKKKIENIASVFSYPSKIRNILHLSSEPVSNAYVTRWKDNKKMAINVITDDAKINDYLYRAEGKVPGWVQMAIATRNLYGINYHRFCYVGNRIFYLKRFPLLSTMLSTFLCLIGIGKSLRKEFKQKNLSYLLHTNTHAIIHKLDPNGIKNEIQKSEKVWVDKWNNGTPLSHIFSYTSPYGIPTKKGTKEKIAFSASKSMQWIREWPIPNAPLDFFLPTRLFWGICVGEFFDKDNCKKLKDEFSQRYNNCSDYMIISGHVPGYNAECPEYVTEMLEFFQNHNGVWLAGSDEIIKYYKARENITLSRIKKQGEKFLIEINNNLPGHFSTDITLLQNVNSKINKIQFTVDKENDIDVKFKFIGKNTIMYDIPSDTKSILIS